MQRLHYLEEAKMRIKNYDDVDLYAEQFQWAQPRSDQKPLFIVGAEFQAHFLYFGGHTLKKKQALKKCLEAYHQHFQSYLKWGGYYDDDGIGHYAELDAPDMPSIADVIEKAKHPNDQVEWYCASGEKDEAPEFMIFALTNREWEGQKQFCSEVRFSVPHHFIFDARMRYVILQLIQMFIDKLGAYFAVAGFQNSLPYKPYGIDDYVRQQSERFLGINQGTRCSERGKIKNGIKSTDWLTYVSNSLVQRICDVESFMRYCRKFELKPKQQKHGFLFMLEEYPQLLPNYFPVLPSYFNLNRALRPLRHGSYSAFSRTDYKEYSVLDIEATRKWIRRLDAPNIFPDQGHYQECRPKKRNVYLASGQVCKVDGVYRYDDQVDLNGDPVYVGYDDRDYYESGSILDYRQHVVLLKGDIAPRFLECLEHGALKQARKIKWHLVSEIIQLKK